MHIHFKIPNSPTAASGFEFTSQVFFDESTTDGSGYAASLELALQV